MPPEKWFELSDDGWRRLAAQRSLGSLLLEAIQNAFDAGASAEVALGEREIVIEDDAPVGFADRRLVYTVFLSSKQQDPQKRGRLGRGLKELIASVERATVETEGVTLDFGPEGRRERPNARRAGSRIVLRREFGLEELASARRLLHTCIPPRDQRLVVDGVEVERPPLLITLPSCELESVEVLDGVERAVVSDAPVTLYRPFDGTIPHIFEMGIPVCRWNAPWHADVGQRVPVTRGREAVTDAYALRLKALLFEALIHNYLDQADLRAEWVHEVIARYPLEPEALDAYVSRAFPRGAVLGGSSRANDRARQLGAHVIDPAALSLGERMALEKVIEEADAFILRRSSELGAERVEPDAAQRRFAEAVTWLARRLAGQRIRVEFFAQDPSDSGLLEGATADPHARVLAFNVRGAVRFEDILDPATLGLVLHELAHLDCPEHDHRFIERLQLLAGQTARLLADGGPDLATALRRGTPPGGR